MHLVMNTDTSQSDAKVEEPHLLNEIGLEVPQPPTIRCFLKQRRGHLDALLDQKSHPEPLLRVPNETAIICIYEMELCPKGLATLVLPLYDEICWYYTA